MFEIYSLGLSRPSLQLPLKSQRLLRYCHSGDGFLTPKHSIQLLCPTHYVAGCASESIEYGPYPAIGRILYLLGHCSGSWALPGKPAFTDKVCIMSTRGPGRTAQEGRPTKDGPGRMKAFPIVLLLKSFVNISAFLPCPDLVRSITSYCLLTFQETNHCY